MQSNIATNESLQAEGEEKAKTLKKKKVVKVIDGLSRSKRMRTSVGGTRIKIEIFCPIYSKLSSITSSNTTACKVTSSTSIKDSNYKMAFQHFMNSSDSISPSPNPTSVPNSSNHF